MAKSKMDPQVAAFRAFSMSSNSKDKLTSAQRRFRKMMENITNDKAIASVCQHQSSHRSSFYSWHNFLPQLCSELTQRDEVVH